MVDQLSDDQLNTELADAFSELVEQVIGRFEAVGRRFSLPAFCVKALHMLSSPMAMKELGQRFHCDPSFVTSIADTLDAHGLGRRETDTRDRRIKNLTLTPKGLELRARLEREITAIMPWTGALDPGERECLLGLLRKMVKAGQQCGTNDPPQAAKASPASTDPAVATGGSRAGEVKREPTPAAPAAASSGTGGVPFGDRGRMATVQEEKSR
jgi:MarR family transcriptional regulator, organic hydroperoxide resistance regulator